MTVHSIVLIFCALACGQDSDLEFDGLSCLQLTEAHPGVAAVERDGVLMTSQDGLLAETKPSDQQDVGQKAIAVAGHQPPWSRWTLGSLLETRAGLQIHSQPAQLASKGWLLGIIMGLTPDHVAVMFTLAAGLSRSKAFIVGATWGVGHSVGQVALYLLFLYANHLVKPEYWELVGNYGAGAMLMLLGGYFVLREDTFVEEREGEFLAKPCACCSGHDSGGKEPVSSSFWQLMSGMALGIFNGLCCPTFLVTLGVFSSVAAAPHSHRQDVVFLLCYTLSTCLTSGIVAAVWTSLIHAATGSLLSFRTAYRACCAATVTIGAVWLVANLSGRLRFIDYGDVFAHQIA